jgi:uncharacterized protein YecT (DUF1311 family)
MRTLGLAALVSLVLVGAGCGSSREANTSMRPGGILVSAVNARPTLPTKAGRYSVLRFGCPKNQGTTVAMEACLGEKALRLDRKFNRTVAALWPLLSNTERRSFNRAQRDWLRYRKQQCESDVLRYRGGSIVPIYLATCELRVTAARLKDVAMTFQLYHQGR